MDLVAGLLRSPADVHRGVVRVHRRVLAALGVAPWSTVAVRGSRWTVALVGVAPETATEAVVLLDPLVAENAGVAPGDGVHIEAVSLPVAERVQLDSAAGLPERTLRLHLLGKPVARGDRVSLLPQDYSRPPGYEAGAVADAVQTLRLGVVDVIPDGAAIVGAATRFDVGLAAPAPAPVSAAELIGYEEQRRLLAEWLSLFISPENVPAQWGLERAAGALVTGPPGCGKRALVAAATADVGARLVELSTTGVASVEDLRNVLESALAGVGAPAVVLADRIEDLVPADAAPPAVGAVEAFLARVAGRPGRAAVFLVDEPERLHPAVARSALLPRTLAMPPPDQALRHRILVALTTRVPRAPDCDLDALAAATAGYTRAGLAAVVQVAAATAFSRRAGGAESPMVAAADFRAALEAVPPSCADAGLGELPDAAWDAVCGLTDVKARLEQAVVWPLTHPDTFARLGVSPPQGILLFGPPGNGKTFLVRALAHRAGCAFFPVKGAELLSQWVGESERGVRDLFTRARRSAPALVFLDEVDALAPARGHAVDDVTDRVVAALLTELDGIAARGDVVVIAATNRPDLVDPALLRPGRLELHLEVGPPDRAAREAILRSSTAKLAASVDVPGVAAALEGASAAEVTGTLRAAAMSALRESLETEAVESRHVEAALAACGRRGLAAHEPALESSP